MIQLTDEFGARVWIIINTIKFFKENIGGMFASQHKRALSVIENSYGDQFYVLETCEEIVAKIFPKEAENADEEVQTL